MASREQNIGWHIECSRIGHLGEPISTLQGFQDFLDQNACGSFFFSSVSLKDLLLCYDLDPQVCSLWSPVYPALELQCSCCTNPIHQKLEGALERMLCEKEWLIYWAVAHFTVSGTVQNGFVFGVHSQTYYDHINITNVISIACGPRFNSNTNSWLKWSRLWLMASLLASTSNATKLEDRPWILLNRSSRY